MESGLSIGLRVAARCTAVITQEALSSFHKAGKIALIDNESYLKYMKLETKDSQSISYIFGSPIHSLSELRLCDVIVNMEWKQSEYALKYQQEVNNNISIPESQCLSITLNRDILYERRLSPTKIAKRISESTKALLIIPSPIIDMKIEVFSIDNLPLSIPKGLAYKDPVIKGSLYNMVIDGINGLGKEHKGIHKMSSIMGVQSIMGEECLICFGTNLMGIMKVPGVDIYKVYSNSIEELYKYFGIVITRRMILNYMATMLNDKVHIDSLLILINAMTVYGYPISVAKGTDLRTTMFKLTTGFHMKQVTNAPSECPYSITSDFDRIMTGQKIITGTGFTTILPS